MEYLTKKFTVNSFVQTDKLGVYNKCYTKKIIEKSVVTRYRPFQ